jgi:hypothetical protein
MNTLTSARSPMTTLIASQLENLKSEELEIRSLLASQSSKDVAGLRERLARWSAGVDRLQRMMEAF